MFDKLPEEIRRELAQRAMRMHHYLWHQVRNTWNQLTKKEQKAIEELGWKPPRPAMNENGSVIYDNESGEDFLYMHHHMIQDMNKKLKALNNKNYLRVKGWENIPSPDDKDYPVPKKVRANDETKSTKFYNEKLKPQEDKLKNLDYLTTVSLGQLGSEIEFTIHNWMHVRWSANPGSTRPEPDSTISFDSIDKKWDDVSYDWLGDPYSSHVNSIFWKLHGWVDDRIEDWKKANPDKLVHHQIIWKGKWIGNMPKGSHDISSSRASTRFNFNREGGNSFMAMNITSSHSEHLGIMDEVFSILAKSGKCYHFYDTIPKNRVTTLSIINNEWFSRNTLFKTNHYGKAKKFYYKKDYSRALFQLELILQTYPKHPEKIAILNMCGNSCKYLGNIENALIYFNEILKIEPNYYEALLSRGNIYKAQGHTTKAMEDFNEVLEIDPDNCRALLNRGNIYNAQGHATKAMEDFDEILEIDPDNYGALLNRGNVYKAQGYINKAFIDYKTALSIKPTSKIAQAKLQEVEQELDSYCRAPECILV